MKPPTKESSLTNTIEEMIKSAEERLKQLEESNKNLSRNVANISEAAQLGVLSVVSAVLAYTVISAITGRYSMDRTPVDVGMLKSWSQGLIEGIAENVNLAIAEAVTKAKLAA